MNKKAMTKKEITESISDIFRFDEFKKLINEVYELFGYFNPKGETTDKIKSSLEKLEEEIIYYIQSIDSIKDKEKNTAILSAVDTYLFFIDHKEFKKDKAIEMLQGKFDTMEESLEVMAEDILDYRVNPYIRGIALPFLLTQNQMKKLAELIMQKYKYIEKHEKRRHTANDHMYSIKDFMGAVSCNGDLPEEFIIENIEYFDMISLENNKNQKMTPSLELLIDYRLKDK